MSADTPLIIVGGNSPAGHYLMQRLAAAGLTAHVISRRALDVPVGFTKISVDLNVTKEWRAPKGAVIFSLLPLWILTEFLPCFVSARAIVATGSTSRFSKAKSMDASERSIASKLEVAEEVLKGWAAFHAINWTLLRPTMIYDCQNDQNITRMAHFIRRWHFLPLAAPAEGLRQPIHTDDVAKAMVQCLDNPVVANKDFNIAGGEVLPYRRMAERLFIALGQKPRFIIVPAVFLQKAFHVAAWVGIVKEKSFGASMFQRMNEDLVFDVKDGLRALNYDPRPFVPKFGDEMP